MSKRTFLNCERCGVCYETTKGKNNLEFWCQLGGDYERKGICCFCKLRNKGKIIIENKRLKHFWGEIFKHDDWFWGGLYRSEVKRMKSGITKNDTQLKIFYRQVEIWKYIPKRVSEYFKKYKVKEEGE